MFTRNNAISKSFSPNHNNINVLCLFLTVPWVGLQYVIVAFPGHTYF